MRDPRDMTSRRTDGVFTVPPGHWLVLVPQQDGAATVLTVEPDERSAVAWRAELVRRIVATPESGHHVLTTADGRVLHTADAPAAFAGMQRGATIHGPVELLVVRVETTLPPMRRADARLHRLLPGRFPS